MWITSASLISKEVSHEMLLRGSRFTKHIFFHTKSVPRNLCFSIQSPSPNLDDLLLRCDGCETASRVWSGHVGIMLGSFPHCKWNLKFFCAYAVDRILLWFATVGSFPQCKWDCKWCWWMSCRWGFEGSLARNAFLRDSRCTKPYVFPYKVRPRTTMIYLCGATGARRSLVWSHHVRIRIGSVL